MKAQTESVHIFITATTEAEATIPNSVAAGGRVQDWSGDGYSLMPRKLVRTVLNDKQLWQTKFQENISVTVQSNECQRRLEVGNKPELMSTKTKFQENLAVTV